MNRSGHQPVTLTAPAKAIQITELAAEKGT